jgi:hypothetical protein
MIHRYPLPKKRRGLAPLEMVLAMPFLLMILALIVGIGNLIAWKVQTLTSARHAIWGSLSPSLMDHKTGANDLRPEYWPANAMSGSDNLGKAASVGDVENRLGARKPVVRGLDDANPILPLDNNRILEVNAELLDPAIALRMGSARMMKPLPMLKSLGNYPLQARTAIFDYAWRCTEMGIGNYHFRLNLIYPAFQPPNANNPVLPILLTMYNAIYRQNRMALLDGTEADFIKFQTRYGQATPTFIGSIPGWTPLNFYCSANPGIVRQSVNDLADRISGSRKKSGPLMDLSASLQGYYNSVRQTIEGLMNAQPPPSGTQLDQMKKDIETLENYMRQLQQFMRSL